MGMMQGKAVLVTGAGRGVGRGIALALAEAVITHERALNAWCNWCRVRREAEGLGLQAMVRLAERDAPDAAGFKHCFEVAYARWYATWAIDADPLIREFVAAEHNSKIDTFRALDERLAQLTVRYIKTLLAGGIPRKDAALMDEGYGVLRHQLQLQRRHKAIRQLVAETASPALLAPLRRAANEAAALAWLEAHPLLVFPELFQEKARTARLRLQRQERLTARTAPSETLMVAEAA